MSASTHPVKHAKKDKPAKAPKKVKDASPPATGGEADPTPAPVVEKKPVGKKLTQKISWRTPGAIFDENGYVQEANGKIVLVSLTEGSVESPKVLNLGQVRVTSITLDKAS